MTYTDQPFLFLNKETDNSSLALKFIQALFPSASIRQEAVDYSLLDTYVLIHSYKAEEPSHASDYIKKANELLEQNQLNKKMRILIILYEDVKVAFPERKLRNEKAISDVDTDDLLMRYAPHHQDRIRVIYEFGTHDLRDTKEQLKTAKVIYFDSCS